MSLSAKAAVIGDSSLSALIGFIVSVFDRRGENKSPGES